MLTVCEKLDLLREQMRRENLDGYIVPSSDPHMSEYVPARFRSRAYITGFSGSAGTLSLLQAGGTLYVDGRYILQAAEQTEGSGLEVSLIGAGKPEPWSVFCDRLKSGDRVGCDAQTFSVSQLRQWEKALAPYGIELVPGKDLIDAVWADRPGWPDSRIWIHETDYAAMTPAEKIAKVRDEMAKEKIDHLLVGALDDIAWLTNLRGADVTDVPVFCSWIYMDSKTVQLFVHEGRLDDVLTKHLTDNGITVCAYEAVTEAVAATPEGDTIAYDPKGVNLLVGNAIPKGCVRKETGNITTYLKACKTPEELENMRQAHLIDGLAMCRFMQWLPEAMKAGNVTELDVCDKLIELRKENAYCIGESFSTIAASGAHGAMMHYDPANGGNCVLPDHGLMVLDSGAQYLYGTTDITRTVVLGELTEQEKWDYTISWKAHVALAEAKFPEGTTGMQLDTLARAPIWKYGLDYRCGTGHGVGLCLSVHEGPVGIRPSYSPIPLKEGMVLTDEPGIYRADMHGIRHENVVAVVPFCETEYGKYLQFEPLTLCPFDTRGIEKSLLDQHEIDYLNAYNRMVCEKISPLADESLRGWLEEAARPI